MVLPNVEIENRLIISRSMTNRIFCLRRSSKQTEADQVKTNVFVQDLNNHDEIIVSPKNRLHKIWQSPKINGFVGRRYFDFFVIAIFHHL